VGSKVVTAMKNVRTLLLTGFAIGFLTALLVVSGCGKADDRTLTVYQFQSTKTYTGQFLIDTSELPPDAIDKRTDSGKQYTPETRLDLNMDYELEIVLRLAKSDGSTATDGGTSVSTPGDASNSL
jgi:hypothetical protein